MPIQYILMVIFPIFISSLTEFMPLIRYHTSSARHGVWGGGGGENFGELLRHSAHIPCILFIVESCLLLKIVSAPDLLLDLLGWGGNLALLVFNLDLR